MMEWSLKEAEKVGSIVEAIMGFCQLSILWPKPQAEFPALEFITPWVAAKIYEYVEKGVRTYDSYVSSGPMWKSTCPPYALKKPNRARNIAPLSVVRPPHSPVGPAATQ